MTQSIPQKVHLAIVGAGGISAAHAEGIKANSDRLECVALCDISEDNLRARSKQLGGVALQFNDWNTMFQEAGDKIDAVIICLPHHLHAPAILDAARAGKHVLCEKPMCINLKEADAILDAVAQSGIIYMSAHNQLFDPVVQEAKRWIDQGRIGALRWVRSQDCFIPEGEGRSFHGKWRAQRKLQGGGELIDTGYHPSYRLLYLVGAPVAQVRSTMGRFEQQIEGEDTASVQVRFANGVIGEILSSWAMEIAYGSHQIHVCGDEGQIFGTGNELFLLPRGFYQPAKMQLPQVLSFNAQIAHFDECIREQRRPIHSAEEGRAVLQLILKATENADGWQKTAR